jgi:hypothetical protein
MRKAGPLSPLAAVGEGEGEGVNPAGNFLPDASALCVSHASDRSSDVPPQNMPEGDR